jgi:hypothetical protein
MNRLKELICELIAHLRKKGVRVEISHIEGRKNVVADRLSRPSDDLKRDATTLAELYVVDGEKVSESAPYVTRSGRTVRPIDLFGEWSVPKRQRTEVLHESPAGMPRAPESSTREEGPAASDGPADSHARGPTLEPQPGKVPVEVAESDELDFEAPVYEDGEVRALAEKGWIRKRSTKRGHQWVVTTLWGRLKDGAWIPCYKPGSILVPKSMAREVVRRAHRKGHPGRKALRKCSTTGASWCLAANPCIDSCSAKVASGPRGVTRQNWGT